MAKINLTVETIVEKVGGKAGFMTRATIRNGRIIVATANLPGKNDRDRVLKAWVNGDKGVNNAPLFAALTREQRAALAV